MVITKSVNWMRSPVELVQIEKRTKKLSYSTLSFRGRSDKGEPTKGTKKEPTSKVKVIPQERHILEALK